MPDLPGFTDPWRAAPAPSTATATPTTPPAPRDHDAPQNALAARMATAHAAASKLGFFDPYVRTMDPAAQGIPDKLPNGAYPDDVRHTGSLGNLATSLGATLSGAVGDIVRGTGDITTIKPLQRAGEFMQTAGQFEQASQEAPWYQQKTALGLTDKGGLTATNIVNKVGNTLAGMAPGAIAGVIGGAPAASAVFGLQGEGQGREAGEQQASAMNPATLAQQPYYQQALAKGMTPEQARQAFIDHIGNVQGITGGLTGLALGAVPEIPGVKQIGGAITKAITKHVGARAAQIVGEGIGEGLGFGALNAGGQVVNNVTNPIDTPAMQGVGEGLASGLLVGGLMGGARGFTEPLPPRAPSFDAPTLQRHATNIVDYLNQKESGSPGTAVSDPDGTVTMEGARAPVPLSDAERAHRDFLAANLGDPAALAQHFGVQLAAPKGPLERAADTFAEQDAAAQAAPAPEPQPASAPGAAPEPTATAASNSRAKSLDVTGTIPPAPWMNANGDVPVEPMHSQVLALAHTLMDQKAEGAATGRNVVFSPKAVAQAWGLPLERVKTLLNVARNERAQGMTTADAVARAAELAQQPELFGAAREATPPSDGVLDAELASTQGALPAADVEAPQPQDVVARRTAAVGPAAEAEPGNGASLSGAPLRQRQPDVNASLRVLQSRSPTIGNVDDEHREMATNEPELSSQRVEAPDALGTVGRGTGADQLREGGRAEAPTGAVPEGNAGAGAEADTSAVDSSGLESTLTRTDRTPGQTAVKQPSNGDGASAAADLARAQAALIARTDQPADLTAGDVANVAQSLRVPVDTVAQARRDLLAGTPAQASDAAAASNDAAAHNAGLAAMLAKDPESVSPQPIQAIDRTHNVGLLGGVSADGGTVYLDKSLPKQIPVPRADGSTVMVDTGNIAFAHEAPEFSQMHERGKDYGAAHSENANTYEDAFYQKKYGVSRAAVDKALARYIKQAEQKAAAGAPTPADLDTKPYVDSDKENLLNPDTAAPANRAEVASEAAGFPAYERWAARERAVAQASIDSGAKEHARAARRISDTQAALRGKMPKADRDALKEQLRGDRTTLAATAPGSFMPVDAPERDITPERYARAKAIFERDGSQRSGPDISGPRNAAETGPQRTDEIARNDQRGTAPTPIRGDIEQPATTTGPQATADVGEQLTANRRNLYSDGMSWAEIGKQNPTLRVRDSVKAKVYPKPDWQKLVENGMNPIIARAAKSVYDAFAAKPRTLSATTDAKLENYVDTLSALRDALPKWMEGVSADPNVREALSRYIVSEAERLKERRFPIAAQGKELLGAMKPYNDALFGAIFPHPVDAHSAFGTSDEGSRLNNARAHIVGGNKTVRALQVHPADLFNAARDIVETGWPKASEAWRKSFAVHATGSTGAPEYYVTHARQIVAKGFKTKAEAESAAQDAWAKLHQRANAPFTEESVDLRKAQRSGAQVRTPDEHITSQRLMDTFGFRGVNFGNWMLGAAAGKSAERQMHLDEAYDALHDLSTLTGLPPRALSLEGKLGLAFGAQGHGGGARAHFVPGVNEINLTRTSGVGSLAHEWGHALDHYFAAQAGDALARSAGPFATHAAEAGTLHGTALRPEIEHAFQTLYDTMVKQPTSELDAAQIKSLWDKRLSHEQSSFDRTVEQLKHGMGKDARERFEAGQAVLGPLLDKLKKGDMGEGYVPNGKSRTSAVHPVVAQLAEEIKVITGRSPRSGEMSDIERAANGVRYVMEGKDTWRPAQTAKKSEFRLNAGALDHASSRNGRIYYRLPTELFARAFQSYVIDRLAGRDARNDYLSRPLPDRERVEQLVKDGVWAGDPYPRGEEANRINGAIDTLLHTIKTRATPEGNIGLFSSPDELTSRGGAQTARTLGLPATLKEPLSAFRNDQPLKHDPDYKAAKAGNAGAAVRLVKRLAGPLLEQARAKFGSDVIYVAPHAEEATGKNAIPHTLAEALAVNASGSVDEDIVQTNRVHHTGADLMQRMIARSQFNGDVKPGGRYVLVDDVTTSGGTFADLADYIRSKGGEVAGAVSLVNAARDAKLAADPQVVRRLEGRHGDVIREQLGIEPGALTASEARYLDGFRSADEIRNRVAKARQERIGRLRAKGIQGLESRPGAEIADNAPPQARRSGHGVPLEDVERIVADVRQHWGNDQPRVKVRDSAEALPATAKRQAGYQTAEGFYDGKTVYLIAPNLRSAARVRKVLAHEAIGHYGLDRVMDAHVPGGWKKFIADVARLRNDPNLGGKALRDALNEVELRYRNADGTPADAETFARELPAVMAEHGVRNGLLKRVVAAVRAYLRKVMPNLHLNEAELRQLLVKSDRFLREGEPYADRVARTQALAFANTRRSAFRDESNYHAALNDFLAGRGPQDKDIQVTGGTPDVLRKLGARDLPIEMAPSIARKVINEHGLGRAVLTDLVRQLHEPVMVFESRDEAGNVRPGQFAILTELQDAAGKQVMVAIHLNKRGEQYRINSIRSAYGRPESQYARWLAEGRALYVDTSKTPAWSNTRGLQLPKADSVAGVSRHTVLTDKDVVKPFSTDTGAYASVAAPFYSALTEAVNRAQGAPKKADAAAWKQWLDGAQRRGEFKGAEREWMGLDEWLDNQKEPVTRAQLLEHVRENEVHVQEVMHADEVNPSDASDIAEDEDGNFVLAGGEGERAGSTKFGGYTLPGGKNYRELLLTLPQRGASREQPESGFAHVEQLPNGRFRIRTDSGTSLSFETRAEADAFILRAAQNLGRTTGHRQFRSQHFDEPNILVHVRFNDRTGPNGEKILHVEEVQSDWHQAGRKRGYNGPPRLPTRAQYDPDIESWVVFDQNGHDFGIVPGPAAKNEQEALAGASRYEVGDVLREGDNLVPDAPLKKTEQWSMLAMKRVLRYAAEHGYDKVTWTTGEQQAARYDLSKHVRDIKVMRHDRPEPDFRAVTINTADGRTVDVGVDKDGIVVAGNPALRGKRLDEVVGKDTANKIMQVQDHDTIREFSGGEGMRAFYDKMLPNEVAKYVKKWGAKVGESTIDTQGTGFAERMEYVGPTMTADQVREVARGQNATVEHQLDAVASMLESRHSLHAAMSVHGSIAGARALGGEMVPLKHVYATVHSVDITPAMRESVMQGQPLFSRAEPHGAFSRPDPDRDQRPGDPRRDPARSMRALGEALAAKVPESVKQGLKDWLRGKAEDVRPKALKLIQTTHLLELMEDVAPLKGVSAAYRKYWTGLKNMRALMLNGDPAAKDHPTDMLARGAFHMAERMRQFVFKKGLAGFTGEMTPEGRLMSDLMNQSTIAGVDPSEDYHRIEIQNARGERQEWTKENVAARKALVSELLLQRGGDSLSSREQLEDERKFLNHIGAHEKQRQADYARLKKQFDQLPEEGKKLFRDTRDYYAQLQAKFQEQLQKNIESYNMPDNYKRSLQAQLRARFEQERNHGIYFPLSRDGDYWVAFHSPDGGYGFKMFESQMEQTQAVKKLRASHFTIDSTGRRFYGKQNGKSPLDQAPGGSFVHTVIGDMKKAGVSEKTQDLVYQAFLRTFPEMSLRKHFIHRKKVLGFSDDVTRTFAKNAYHGAYQLSRLTYAPKMLDALQGAEQTLDAWRKGEERIGPRAPNALEKFVNDVLDKFEKDPAAEQQAAANAEPAPHDQVSAFMQKQAASFSGPGAKVEREAWNIMQDRWNALPLDVRNHYTQEALDAAFPGAERMDAPKSPADVSRADTLLGELTDRHNFIMNPTDASLANKVNGFTFLWYLGASPASAFTNMMQVAQVVLPVLGARHTWAKAVPAVTRAWRDAIRTGGKMDKVLKDPDEKRAFLEMQQRQVFSQTRARDLGAISEGNRLKMSPQWVKVMDGVTWMFHTAEVINRETAAMASYRLSRAEGLTHDQAMDRAVRDNEDTNFNYDADNRPPVMRGNTMRILTQFKNYGVGMTWRYYRDAYKAFAAEDPEVRKQALKSVTGMLAMTAILAGTVGLPMYSQIATAANAANTVFGDPNAPFNFDDSFHAWLREHLGETGARLVAEGPASYLTGADLSDRLGMSNMWIRDDGRQLEGADAYHALLESLAGPSGQILNNFYVGMEDIQRGKTERGMERLLPSAVKNGIKGMRFATQGTTTLTGNPIVPDINGWEDFVQALGFEPARLAAQYQINTAQKNFTTAVAERRTDILNGYALAVTHGDDGDERAAMDKITAFNRQYPQWTISRQTVTSSMRQRARMSQRANHGVILNPRLAPMAQQYAGVAQ